MICLNKLQLTIISCPCELTSQQKYFEEDKSLCLSKSLEISQFTRISTSLNESCKAKQILQSNCKYEGRVTNKRKPYNIIINCTNTHI